MFSPSAVQMLPGSTHTHKRCPKSWEQKTEEKGPSCWAVNNESLCIQEATSLPHTNLPLNRVNTQAPIMHTTHAAACAYRQNKLHRHTHTHVHTHTHTCMHAHTCTYTHTLTCMHACTHTRTCTCTLTCRHAHAHTHTYTHTHACTHAHTHIHTHTHTHTHTDTDLHVGMGVCGCSSRCCGPVTTVKWSQNSAYCLQALLSFLPTGFVLHPAASLIQTMTTPLDSITHHTSVRYPDDNW